MQKNEVKAFRQRLVRGGFTSISIFDNYRGKYYVRCVSPEGKAIQVQLTLNQMEGIPKLVYFDDYLQESTRL